MSECRARPRRALSRCAAATLMAGLLAAWALVAPSGEPRAQSPADDARPNLLVVMTDDQTLRQFNRRYMPRTFRALRTEGTWFREAVASPPLCCPMRAGLMTGQYSHNHGVTDNLYSQLTDTANILPTWLSNAGYTTALIGKYMNNYELVEGSSPAPGFDRWMGFDGRPSYYGSPLSIDGEVVERPVRRDQYATDVVTGLARELIREAAAEPEPFFAWVSHWAPHEESGDVGGCTGHSPKAPDRASLREMRGERAPRTPDFNEADVSDKPRWIRERDPLTREHVRRIDMRWRCAAAAVREVDRGIGQIVGELRRTGQWQSTVIAFLSDNGYTHGQHRIGGGKPAFYEHVVRVPMVIRVPATLREGRSPRVSNAAVSTVDLAPTLLDYAGDPPTCLDPSDRTTCRRMDGRSLEPILDGRGNPWGGGRAIPFKLEFGCADYEAIRTRDVSHLRPGSPRRCGRARETYRLDRDPFQLQNLAARPRARSLMRRAERRLDRLMACSGVAGRDRRLGDRPFCQ